MTLNPMAFTPKDVGDFLRYQLTVYRISHARLHDQMQVLLSLENDLEVTIRCSPRIARWIRERYGEEAEGQPDGSVVVRHRARAPGGRWHVC